MRIAVVMLAGIHASNHIALAIVMLLVGIAVHEVKILTVLNILLSVTACSEKARNLLSGSLSKSKDRKRQCSVIFLMIVTEYTKHEAFNC